MLSVKDISCAYGEEVIFENVSFDCRPGKITSIIGVNGTGKTTLLKCIAGLQKLRSGEVFINGRARKEMSKEDFAASVGYLDQNNYCDAQLNVYEVILLGRIRNLSFKVSEEDRRRVESVSDMLGITRFLNRNITDLSGGQRQMVFIAQTLVKEPKLLILDEPTSALDINHQFKLMNLISRLTRERDLTTLTTLHHLDVASKYSDSVIVLNDRGVYTQGASDSVVTREMLREVYRVESEMFTDVYGCVHAVPTKEL